MLVNLESEPWYPSSDISSVGDDERFSDCRACVECLERLLEGRWMLRGGGETTSEDLGLALLTFGPAGREDTGLMGREGLPVRRCEFRRGSVIIFSGLSTTIESLRPPFVLPLLLLLLLPFL